MPYPVISKPYPKTILCKYILPQKTNKPLSVCSPTFFSPGIFFTQYLTNSDFDKCLGSVTNKELMMTRLKY